MYKLIALGNLGNLQQASVENYEFDATKKAIALNLMKEIRNSKYKLSETMDNMTLLSECFIDLSVKMKDISRQQERISIKNSKLFRTIQTHRSTSKFVLPVLTIPPEVGWEAAGSEFGIANIDVTAVVAGNAITRPLILTFLLNSGQSERVLLKPSDDLRQDAVMEQVFDLVNELFLRNFDCKQRDLKLRGYNVVPLTPNVGLVQFVPNTISLGDYLIPAHAYYFPQDWEYDKCRAKMKTAGFKDKEQMYRSVLGRFHPVMYRFFLEYSQSPIEWFYKRLAYVRSVAVNSMVGHILGLGDRHLQNMLLDKSSAEIIQIDFGVAFEQGKLLRIPELVPFRLTPDIVNGMGIQGVEGIFRRCCVKSLTVLRESKHMLITVLEVFVHDPLFKWSISPLKLKLKQREDILGTEPAESIGGENARNAIFAVINKLDGIEDLEPLSVEGQVNDLSRRATDVTLLSTMFEGWSSWC